jgi:hypothetical protein
MITSKITGKTYNAGADCLYVTNMLQTKKYLEYLGPEFLLDVLWTSEHRPDALVFVWKKCPETKKAKELWDKHEL